MARSHASPALQQLLSQRLRYNERATYQYAITIAALMTALVLMHLARAVGHRKGITGAAKVVLLPCITVSRLTRKTLLRPIPLFPSVGHALLVTVFLAVNVAFSFVQYHPSEKLHILSNLGSRTGWLALANTALLVLLALRNTPLTFVSTWSHERLSYLHQVVGYAALIHVVVHAATYTLYFCNVNHNCRRLFELSDVYGMMAGVSFVVVVFAGAVVRRRWYEAFYYLHVSFWVLAIIFAWLHQPYREKGLWKAVIAIAGIWVLDRVVRLVRILVTSIDNKATLYPLPNGGTRIVFKKDPALGASGQHAFVWIPGIRRLETHPFTIAALKPAEFVVASYDGFTKDLHDYAVRHPGATLKASLEGSYGTVPDMGIYDGVVLIAGGSGASFTFGTVSRLLDNTRDRVDQQRIVFVWIVRNSSYFAWFEAHLEALRLRPSVMVRLYTTRTSIVTSCARAVPLTTPSATTSPTLSGTASIDASSTMAQDMEMEQGDKGRLHTCSRNNDPEKFASLEPCATTAPSVQNDVNVGRPDVQAIIQTAIGSVSANGRVLVMGCGPKSLMQSVRQASQVRMGGPSVDVHCEQFMW